MQRWGRPQGVRRALAVSVVSAVLLGGCGNVSEEMAPTGVDELVVPTPSPDPADFVDTVDNRWFPLPTGQRWTYDVVEVTGSQRLTVVAGNGPTVAGVATTQRVSSEAGETTTDWFAQDVDGNVWWFGRAGEWTAGVGGAEAGLAMPASPRVGDGYRTGYLPGVVEDVAEVQALDGSATVPAGSYDDLVVIEQTTDLEPGTSVEQAWARGVGLVREASLGRTVRLSEVSG